MTDEITEPAPPTVRTTKTRSKRRSLLASSVGNVLEWYEWSTYAVFAPFIAAAMFDNADPVSALLSTFAVFAIGFLMRPLGGIVFGWVADRKGRKFVLVTTMLTMAAGSLVIGLMPTYASIGVGASAILLLARVAQGFAHGGESATANTYVAEIAPPARRGLWGSIVFAAIFGGSVLAYTVGGLVTTSLSDSAVAAWGWRIPFLLGALLALAALWLRRAMDESEVFEAGGETGSATAVAPPSRRRVVRAILLVVAMTSGITAAHYTWTSYVSTYAIGQGMTPNTAYWVTAAAQLIGLAALPLWGRLSDRVGRRPIMIGFALAMIVLQIPLKSLIGPDGWTLLVGSGIALVAIAAPGSILSSIMSEAFPTRIRTQGIGFAYSVSVAVFGGTAPYLNQLFTKLEADWMSSGYIMLLCLCTGIAVYLMSETKGIRLEDARC